MTSVEKLTKAQRRTLQELSRPEEITAMVSILNAMWTAVVAVRFPAHYWIWHLVRTAMYIPARYFRFKAKGWELYLLDWCYYVTYISGLCAVAAFLRIAFGVVTPLADYNAIIIRAGFAMACGPLAWSVFVFRNSLVFHEIDHATSVFIHLSPLVLVWCLRWGSGSPSTVEDAFPGMFRICETREDYAAADRCFATWRGMLWCDACGAPLSAFVGPPATLFLCVWAVPYYSIVLVRWRLWIESTGRETLYSYFAEKQPDFMERCQKSLAPFVGDENAKPLGYMLCHFTVMIGLCLPAHLMWHSFVLHSLLLVAILAKAVDNGSTYMFRIFAYRYAQQCLEKYKDKLS